MRTHISLPKELVDEIDAIAGPRKRSDFIEEAVRLKLLNERQKRALARAREVPGLSPEDYPYWATPELTSKWVHDMRRADQAYDDARRRKHDEGRSQEHHSNSA